MNKCILNHLNVMFRYAVNHRTVRHIRLPSRVISNNIRPYDESSSPTTINDAGDNTATLEPAAQPSSPRLLKRNLKLKIFIMHNFF